MRQKSKIILGAEHSVHAAAGAHDRPPLDQVEFRSCLPFLEEFLNEPSKVFYRIAGADRFQFLRDQGAAAPGQAHDGELVFDLDFSGRVEPRRHAGGQLGDHLTEEPGGLDSEFLQSVLRGAFGFLGAHHGVGVSRDLVAGALHFIGQHHPLRRDVPLPEQGVKRRVADEQPRVAGKDIPDPQLFKRAGQADRGPRTQNLLVARGRCSAEKACRRPPQTECDRGGATCRSSPIPKSFRVAPTRPTASGRPTSRDPLPRHHAPVVFTDERRHRIQFTPRSCLSSPWAEDPIRR